LVGPPIAHWLHDLDTARAAAKRTDKPVMVYFGAAWDTAAKELEHDTFVDGDVYRTLRDDFVTVHIDTTDDDDDRDVRAAMDRLRVVGDPTIVILAPDFVTEIARYNEYVPPATLMRTLRAAKERMAARRARQRSAW
jgi:thiol:disulfide interchange protein